MNKRHSEEDGITHINAYSKGKTKLGRMLSNMSDIGIDHPEYGKFKTLEGFYWWLKTGRETDFFRTGSGFECRNLGQELSEFYVDFDIKIMCRGIIFKILSNIELLQLVQKNNLPIEHYYVNEDGSIYVPGGHWFTDTLNSISERIN